MIDSTDIVQRLHKKHAEGRTTQRALAEEYRIDPSQVSHIVNRKNWKHID